MATLHELHAAGLTTPAAQRPKKTSRKEDTNMSNPQQQQTVTSNVDPQVDAVKQNLNPQPQESDRALLMRLLAKQEAKEAKLSNWELAGATAGAIGVIAVGVALGVGAVAGVSALVSGGKDEPPPEG